MCDVRFDGVVYYVIQYPILCRMDFFAVVVVGFFGSFFFESIFNVNIHQVNKFRLMKCINLGELPMLLSFSSAALNIVFKA